MSTPLEQLTEFQSQVLETLGKIQEPVVEYVGKAASWADERFPELSGLSLPEDFPSAEELIATNAEFASKLVENQKAFALAVVAAAKPVTMKVVKAEETPKAA